MIDFATLNRAAIAALPAVLARIVPGGRIYGREYTVRNPTRADRHPGSFKINLRTGRWADFATGDNGGDVVSLIAFVEDLTQVEAARRLGAFLESGLANVSHAIQGRQAASGASCEDVAARRARALQIWNSAGDPNGTIVVKYLERERRVRFPSALADRVIRYHPRCPWQDGYMPCMIVLLRSCDDCTPTGIQRTALTSDGRKIARRSLGIAGGSAIMLDKVIPGETLAVAEGFETALTGRMLGYGRSWALGSAGELAKFPVIEAVSELLIHLECDVVNVRAAHRCADRWRATGKRVSFIKPRAGSDLNDAIRIGAAS